MMVPEQPPSVSKFVASLQQQVYRTVHGVEVRMSIPECSSGPDRMPASDASVKRSSECFDPEHGIADAVDEANAESFPASDPPANW